VAVLDSRCLCAVVAIGMALTVKETPEEAGFHGAHGDEADHADAGVRADFSVVLKTMRQIPWSGLLRWPMLVRGQCDRAWINVPRFLQESTASIIR